MNNENSYFMNQALQLAQKCANLPNQYPFGAVVIKNGEIIGRGMECTLIKCDPTAHAEIEAIREACKFLKTTSLEGCEIYTSCEPCSMCLATVYWSKIKIVHYACPREQAIKFGFGDCFGIQKYLTNKQEHSVRFKHYMKEPGVSIFRNWFNAYRKK